MPIKLFNPQGLDLDNIIMNNPFEKGKKLKRDHLLFIIHSIMQQRAGKDDEHLSKIGKSDGFVPLHSKILEDKIPNYHACIEYLVNAGVIECDESYSSGKVSKGYRLSTLFRGNSFKKVEVSDYTLCRKIVKDKPFNKANRSAKNFPYLAKWFRTEKLEIDEQSAMNWINDLEAEELFKINNRKYSAPQKLLDEKLLLHDKIRSYKILASRIKEKDYFFVKDSKGYRLHTNLTNLPKGLRQFVTYDGQPLVSIDIKNSQPYMSLPLLNKGFWQSKTSSGKITLRKMSEEIYRETGKNRKERNSIIMFLDSSKTLVQLDFQKHEFIKNVENGTFYEYLVDVFENKAGLYLGSTHKEKRDKVKKMVLTLLFDNDTLAYNRKTSSSSQIFKRLFPIVAKVFGVLKSSDYRYLSVILQRIESHLLLEKICGRISKERPDLPIFTIHDNVVTTVGNEDYIQEVMKDELTKSIGKAPQFSVEHWNK